MRTLFIQYSVVPELSKDVG